MSNIFDKRVITKILSFLAAKEGFEVEKSNGIKSIVRDVFGFRYEITVELLSRVNDENHYKNSGVVDDTHNAS
jgi:hypothetical protein